MPNILSSQMLWLMTYSYLINVITRVGVVSDTGHASIRSVSATKVNTNRNHINCTANKTLWYTQTANSISS